MSTPKPPLSLTSEERQTFTSFVKTQAKLSNLELDLQTSSMIQIDTFEACLNLIKITSSAAYKASTKGWSVKDKRTEMRERGMRYVLLRGELPSRKDENGIPSIPAEQSHTEKYQPKEEDHAADSRTSAIEIPAALKKPAKPELVGFLSYLPTIEQDPDNEPSEFLTLYIYEVHIHPSFQSCGLGRTLMELAEAQASVIRAHKTMLTVFTSNLAGLRFYERLGYQKWDEEMVIRKKRRLRGGKTVESKPSFVILAKDMTGIDDPG